MVHARLPAACRCNAPALAFSTLCYSLSDWGDDYDCVLCCVAVVSIATESGCITAGDLPAGGNLVIGLNPPFGKNNGLANTFVQQAAKFCPRVIVLIVPPEVSIPRHYQVMYEEQDTMKDRCALFTLMQSLIFHWCQSDHLCETLSNRTSQGIFSSSNSFSKNHGLKQREEEHSS